MTATYVLFIQGAGKGAHDEDAALADSLKHALGHEYEVHFPRMPGEAKPDLQSWMRKISAELSRSHGKAILVGHSLGGSFLLKYLAQEGSDKPISGLYLIAAPSWDEDQWKIDDLKLPSDVAEKLSPIPGIFFYHSRDDDVVPFAHLALHAARFPRATIRAVEGQGHQFRNDLTEVAKDIQAMAAA